MFREAEVGVTSNRVSQYYAMSKHLPCKIDKNIMETCLLLKYEFNVTFRSEKGPL